MSAKKSVNGTHRVRGTRAGGWRIRRATGVIAAVALVSSCGSGSSGPELTFAGFGGVTQDVQIQTQLDPFAEETGTTVNQTEPAELAQLKVMVESDNVSWDVIDGVAYMTSANCGTLFEPLDYDVIDVSNIPDEMVTECGVPAYLASITAHYDSSAFDSGDAPADWDDFFDVEAYPGKRAISDSATSGVYELALLADGVAPDDLYPLDHERALKKLDTIREHLIYWGSGADQQQIMEGGRAAFIAGWTGRAHAATANGASFEPMWEATLSTYDVFAVPKGAPNKDTAMEFINFAIGAGPQEAFSDEIPYGAIRSDAPNSDKEDIEKYAPTLDKSDEHGFVPIDNDWWGENLDEMTNIWTEWTAG